MSKSQAQQQLQMLPSELDQHLSYLKLPFMAQHYDELATHAATKQWSHVDYLATLTQGEADWRRDRATQTRMRQARFPVIKTLDQFRWDWPTVINRMQVQNHFSLSFIKDKANCSGQGKTDTKLSRPDDFFIRIGTNIPEIRMLAPTVVEHLDIIDEVITRFLTRPVVALRRTLALHAAKKPLCYRIVHAIPLSAHATRNAVLSQKPLVRMAGVLRTTITVVHQTRIRLTTTQRHLQGIPNQLRIKMIAHRPTHHLT